MNEEQLHIEAETYVEGSMSQEEMQVFEERMAANPEVGVLVHKYRKGMGLLQIDRHTQLLGMVDQLIEEENVTKVAFRLNWYYSVAAAFLVLVTFSFILLRFQHSDRRIAIRSFEHHPGTGILMGNKLADQQGTYTRGMVFYERENFNGAIELLEAVPEADLNYLNAQFYLGNSFLASHQPEKAVRSFQTVLASEHVFGKDKIRWYLALAYLYSGKEKASIQLLEALAADSADIYSEMAIDVLDQMNSSWRMVPGIK